MTLRRFLLGANLWIGVLAAGIAIPILAITVLFVRDIERLENNAKGERAGIAHIIALDRVFRDASAHRSALACSQAPTFPDPTNRDIAALTQLEAERPFVRDRWTKAVAGLRGASDTFARADGLVRRIVPLFVTVSDRSGVTYDPEVPGINLADALAYRLPRAVDALERIGVMICRPDAGRRLPMKLAAAAGSADVLLADAFGDLGEALKDQPLMLPIRASADRAAATTRTAFTQLARYERNSSDPGRAAAARAAVMEATRTLDTLIDVGGPTLDDIVVRRISGLRRRYELTLIPGILAMVAAALFVLVGARSVLQRAEIGRMKRTARELEYHATHDALTGLPNRSAFVARLGEMLSTPAKTSGGASVLFIDLDNFKLVNDSLGHEAGDVVLQAVAARLRSICSELEAEIVARFGGDEFVMLASAGAGADLAARVDRLVERIYADMLEPVVLDRHVQKIVVSASVGIASIDGSRSKVTQAADLLRDADVAMYEAKTRGRARSATFGPAMRERAIQKLRLTNDLRGAAERAEFSLAREPIVRLADGDEVGCEGLIRWQHPRLGKLWPASFIPVAEESGEIVAIGHWVLEKAVAWAAKRPAEFVHINLSVQGLCDETLLQTMSTLVEQGRVRPDMLAVEITEGSLVRAGGAAEGALRRLRALGLRVWIDDFGVEYSSLRYLDRLPVSGLKIDRSFVCGADGRLASPAIVKMVVELARSLSLDVIAEGVETVHQRDSLIRLGCTLGQGNLYTLRAGRAAPHINAAR